MVKRHPVRPSNRGRLPPKPTTDTMPVPVVTLRGTEADPAKIPELEDVRHEATRHEATRHEATWAEATWAETAAVPPAGEGEGPSPPSVPIERDAAPPHAGVDAVGIATPHEPDATTSDADPEPVAAVGLALVGLEPPEDLPDSPFVVPTEATRRQGLVPTDLVAANATLQAFLLNEGLAAVAHWRSLTASQSPAEAVRLQVDEVQRVAEASLTCMGRIAGHFGRVLTTPPT